MATIAPNKGIGGYNLGGPNDIFTDKIVCTQDFAPCIGGPADGHRVRLEDIKDKRVISILLEPSGNQNRYEFHDKLEASRFQTAVYERRLIMSGSQPQREFWFLIPYGSKVEDAISLMLEMHGV